jgi:lipopolysaccharide transport system ATP-binding protein
MPEPVIRLEGVGKMYKIFDSRVDNLLDALGLAWVRFWRPVRAREFWALRDVDLRIGRGERVGVIGRNGSGKTTLLKLLAAQTLPTEGMLKVRGKVQPLMQAGAGFQPELTGNENIRACLAYHGLSPAEIAEREADIAEFTELGRFLQQPFKTYSLGMQTRLAFATATAVTAEVLIIDEVLGAGDAYFFGRSIERMTRLVESGATVVLVTHAMDQITRFCERAIWLDRGRIVHRGPTLEVVKAYQEHIQVLENRRLQAKNVKAWSGRYGAEQLDMHADELTVVLTVGGGGGAYCDVDAVGLRRDDKLEERVEVGGPQDTDFLQTPYVTLWGSDWSAPRRTERGLCRRLECSTPETPKSGRVAFGLYLLADRGDYELEVSYRCDGTDLVAVEVWRNGVTRISATLPATGGVWSKERLGLKALQESQAAETTTSPSGGDRSPTVRRWPGEGSVLIREVQLLGAADQEQAVFQVGTPMSLRVVYEAQRRGTLPILPAATLYRVDGILVSNHVGEGATFDFVEGERREARLDLGPLNLGDGNYVWSVGLYRRLVDHVDYEWYDLTAHSHEFQVVGNGPFENGIFHHPHHWHLL